MRTGSRSTERVVSGDINCSSDVLDCAGLDDLPEPRLESLQQLPDWVR